MKISVRKQQGNRPLGLVVAIAVLIPSTAFMSVAQGQIVAPAKSESPQAFQNIQSSNQPTAGTAKSWLNRAKTAMEQSEMDLAAHYIEIADELYRAQGATQSLLYTPEMARLDLANMKTLATPAAAGSGSSFQLSDVNQMAQGQKPGFPAPTMTPPKVTAEDNRIAATQALLKARQALSRGKVPLAEKMMNSARQFNVDFAAIGDSPDSIQAIIDQQNRLAEMQSSKHPEYNSGAAKFLLEQAQSLISYEDFDTAKMLVEQAKMFPVQFTPAIGNPDQILSQIESAKVAAAATIASASNEKANVMKVLSQAQLAIQQGSWDKAKIFVDHAKSFNLPESAYQPNEVRPWQLELQITRALNRQAPAAAANVMQTSLEETPDTSKVVTAEYDPTTDQTRNVQVSGTTEYLGTMPADGEDRVANLRQFSPIPSRGMQLYRNGLQALDNSDQPRAKEYFQMAWSYQDDLDVTTRQSIQDHLQNLSAPAAAATQATAIAPTPNQQFGQVPSQGPADIATQPSALDLRTMADAKAASFRRLQAEVFSERAKADVMREKSPRQAIDKMIGLRSRVASSELDDASKRPLLRIIDRDIDEFRTYIEKNLPEIMNREQNIRARETVENRRQRNADIETQIQALTEDFNKLMDEGRFAEAEAIARQAQELDSNNAAVVVLTEKAMLASRVARMEAIKRDREEGNWRSLAEAEASSTILVHDDEPLIFGDNEEYLDRAKRRLEQLGRGQYDSEAETRIWNVLKNQKVQGEYRGTLSEAVDQLARQAGVNIIFDGIALNAMGVETDRTVDIPIRDPIALRSALNLIVGSAGLVFVVEDEVIKITSRDTQRKNVKRKIYYVGDLVTPITNFSGGAQMSFLQPGQGNNNGGFAQNNQYSQAGALTAPQQAANNNGTVNPVALAQNLPGNSFGGNGLLNNFGSGNGPQRGTPTYTSVGGPRLGGVTEQDFQPLIELIRTTISPDDWDDTNGDGTIQSFPPNLSLIVSQTQEVQDQIQDLLVRLRELNDVQIVVEVRFITLSDNFFERIGIDFDFQINDNSGLNPAAALPDELESSFIIGNGPGSTNLDLGFLQDSFGSAVPQFGGFDVGTAANFGFAILSDIEVFFLIQASKGDTRSSIMQAPTVTMFNGQSAFINDGANRPFVTQVIPVVGDFAVAHQPVITLLPEGTSLNVQAVVSPDRRFVRMALVPFFSQVTEVDTFTFDGSTTTTTSGGSFFDDLFDAAVGGDGDDIDDLGAVEVETTGVTVQLPVLAQTQINTVVSVPDGGTVLLGGVKRMSEGRTERGVPFLSNVPYVNRLFKNVGIGRDTQNLMMMVTPRIVITAEEEARQVGTIGN